MKFLGYNENGMKPASPQTVMHPCKQCKQRSVLQFSCLCKETFCVRHRLPEDHSCTVDRMKTERETLTKLLVKVVADKLPERI